MGVQANGKKSPWNDHMSTVDGVQAGLAQAAPPAFPCPKCGRETLEHQGPPGTRICSAATCRHVIEPAWPNQLSDLRKVIIHQPGGRFAPSGKRLPDEIWPCYCVVCGEEMTAYDVVEDGEIVKVTHSHEPDHHCKNNQYTSWHPSGVLAPEPPDPGDTPNFPCPKCGKETLEHRGPPGTRICCMAPCRHVIKPSLEKGWYWVRLLPDGNPFIAEYWGEGWGMPNGDSMTHDPEYLEVLSARLVPPV